MTKTDIQRVGEIWSRVHSNDWNDNDRDEFSLSLLHSLLPFQIRLAAEAAKKRTPRGIKKIALEFRNYLCELRNQLLDRPFPSRPKILIVEDDARWHAMWNFEDVEAIRAFSIKEAREKFLTNRDIVLIAMDACVPGDSPTTPPLVREFRKTFHGPIIAISSSESYQQILLNAGCDAKTTKDHLPQKVREILF